MDNDGPGSVRAFDVANPVTPVELGRTQFLEKLQFIGGAGLVGGNFYLFGWKPLDEDNGRLYSVDAAQLASGAPAAMTQHGIPLSSAGIGWSATGDSGFVTTAFAGGVDIVHAGAPLEVCRYTPSSGAWPDPQLCLDLPNSVDFERPVRTTTDSRLYVFSKTAAGASQIYALETGGATLTLGPTGAAFGPRGILDISAGALGGSNQLLFARHVRLADCSEFILAVYWIVGVSCINKMIDAYLF